MHFVFMTNVNLYLPDVMQQLAQGAIENITWILLKIL